MKIKNTFLFIILGLFSIAWTADAEIRSTIKKYCGNNNYTCIKVQKGQSWESLFSDSDTRNIAKRINRMNTPLYRGLTIAVPKNKISIIEAAPFYHHINSSGGKLILVDLTLRAWGAYSGDGKLVQWGPISGGQDYCPDVRRGCRTPVGRFKIYSKGGSDCISTKFPIPRGGAPMPYCMFFHKGYALHGSPAVPGYHASHGCVRMFTQDARWLNQNFIETPKINNDYQGTTVIIQRS
jgi:L,D-transpeptidase ErfK/SrfK